MTVPPGDYRRSVHVMAVITVIVALLPISVGAATTTLRAGMAFPDWPSSDGQNMITYPWFKSAGDKFIEHGHRLAGVVIGLTSIALAVVASISDRRYWGKAWGVAILLAVVVQGLLGGQRVMRDRSDLALVHAVFAVAVFIGMAGFALVTSRRWFDERPFMGNVPGSAAGPSTAGHPSATGDAATTAGSFYGPIAVGVIAGVALCVQYLLGGMLRHMGYFLFEHLAFSVLASFAILALVFVSISTDERWLARGGYQLLFLVICQVAFGVLTWAVKYGHSESSVVVAGSPLQVGVRSLHTVLGMFLAAAVAVQLLRICRLEYWRVKLSAANCGASMRGSASNRPMNGSSSASLIAPGIASAGGVS